MATQSKIQLGAKVKSTKFGIGEITKIITKSTGYVEVTYSDCVKKEMAFNLTDENGVAMKAKPAKQYHTEESAAKANRKIGAFQSDMNMAILHDNFLDCQIQSSIYNSNLIG